MSTLGTSKDVFSFILELTPLTPGTAVCSHGRYVWKIDLSPNILCCSTPSINLTTFLVYTRSKLR